MRSWRTCIEAMMGRRVTWTRSTEYWKSVTCPDLPRLVTVTDAPSQSSTHPCPQPPMSSRITYSRKSQRKQRQQLAATQKGEDETTPARKRRKVEARKPKEMAEEGDTDVDDEGLTDLSERPTTPSRPKSVVTYLSRTPNSTRHAQSFQDLAHSSTPALSSSLSPSKFRNAVDMSSPSRPSPSTKDISQLFSSTFSPSPSTTKRSVGGIAKRMLSRSRTEPTISSPQRTPQPLSLSRTSSSISRNGTLSRQASQNDALSSRSPSPSKMHPPDPPHVPGPSTSSRPPIRTYAGKSRSFLVALPVSSLSSTSAKQLPSLSSHAQDVTRLSQSQDLDLDDDELRESYTDLRARWGIDDSDDIDILSNAGAHASTSSNKGKEKATSTPKPVPPSGLFNDLKSITDLRSRGESRRFLDEVGYLFEGLEGGLGGEGLRRGSLLDLTTRLCQPSFARKARATDLAPRVWDACNDSMGKDKILTPTLALFAALTARDSPALSEFDPPAREALVASLFALLSPGIRGEKGKGKQTTKILASKKDPLLILAAGGGEKELKAAGLGRTEVPMIMRLHALIREKSGLFDENTPISTPLLASHALTSLAPALLPSISPHLRSLFSSLSSHIAILSDRLESYTAGLAFLPSSSLEQVVEYRHLANCLSLVDLYFLGRWGTSEEEDEGGEYVEEMKEEIVGDLVTLLASAAVIKRDAEYKDFWGAADQTTDLALRILVNLSHSNPQICSTLLDDERTVPVVLRLVCSLHNYLESTSTEESENDEDGGEAESEKMDRLCLALALLTNLVQGDERAKDIVRETTLDANCPLRRPCVFSCTCPDRISGVQCLSSLFPASHHSTNRNVKVEEDEEADEDIGIQFLHGHLAILLGLLMQDNLANQALILGRSDFGSSVLDSIIKNGHHLVGLHAEIEKRVSRGSGSDDEANGEGVKGSAGESTMSTMHEARHVISFLETLRDMKS
ncbi:hypothetical protein NEOLEDRAFT_810139 [Neolentinus lepideus HHB14362 ss-1]|uniref:Wings apart-like protein C-terminal domain-containing protein n=1 Tax=Neolentinus lepideus HHB14362 ss-1 TaxID=1314782 RepID=A0A165PE92_9AGAM|nr:hypothetical protein NEOLEDRAFT_810139 [Neolentinus lepideus HHB14362 ss-1]